MVKKKYKPIKLIKSVMNCDNFDEDKYVKMYMKMFGVLNVRGGSYSQINLTEDQIKFINVEIVTSEDGCFRCKKVGHFVKDCKETVKTSLYGKIMGYLFKLNCERCGRNTHNINECYARYHMNGGLTRQ